jgi:ceramide glucosyltransferase
MNDFLIGLSIISCFYSLLTVGTTYLFFQKGQRRQRGQTPSLPLPPVTILKPVKGVDQGAEKNFESYCALDYPSYQLIFCVREKSDPAIQIIQKLIQKFPHKDIGLVISEHETGLNPKVNNLSNGYKKAKYDFIVYNDSDTRAAPSYLKEIVPPLFDHSVGAVTMIPIYRESKQTKAALEAIGINADAIPSIIIPALLGYLDFCIGATIALRREVLEEIGGFKAVANNICDDGYIGKKIFEKGYRIHLSRALISCIHHESRFREFYRHMLRWFVTIRAFSPFKYLMGIFIFGTFYSGVYAILNPGLFSYLLFCSVIGSRLLASAYLNTLYIKDESTFRYLWLLPIRDLILLPIWVQGWYSSKVRWRRICYRVKWGGGLKEEILRPMGSG